MANLEFNTKNIKRVPINRNNFLFSEEVFGLFTQIGKDYVEQFMNQTAVLYQVDLNSTNVDSVYGETKANSVVFKTPVEFHCVYELEEPELKSYETNKNIGTYMKFGKLKIGVYQKTLDELGIQPKVGDYVGIQIKEEEMIYFSISFINPNVHNSGTMYGIKNNWIEIDCFSVDASEFKG